MKELFYKFVRWSKGGYRNKESGEGRGTGGRNKE